MLFMASFSFHCLPFVLHIVCLACHAVCLGSNIVCFGSHFIRKAGTCARYLGTYVKHLTLYIGQRMSRGAGRPAKGITYFLFQSSCTVGAGNPINHCTYH